MHEALDWIVHVRPEDVRVVAAGIADLERSGHRIAWSEIAPRIGLRSKYGRLLGPRPLMMRYRRAIDAIVRALNGGNLGH